MPTYMDLELNGMRESLPLSILSAYREAIFFDLWRYLVYLNVIEMSQYFLFSK